VKKLDANSYSTELNGLKFKLAHKRSTKKSWSASDKAQKKQLINILKSYIRELEKESPEEFASDHEDVIRRFNDARKKAAKKLKTPAVKAAVKKRVAVPA
jgi:hypothetical protein